MTLAQRFVRAYKALSSALPHPATVWSRCPHCDTRTPWVARAWSGYYRCMACRRNPLDSQESS